MIQDSIKGDYYELLKKFGQPSESTITENPGAAHQKATSTPPAEGEAVANELVDNTTAAIQENAPENPQPVAPLTAPTQGQYNVSGDGRGNEGRRCSAACFGCPKLARDCSRRGWENCRLLRSNSPLVKVPDSEEERAKLKDKYRKEQMRKYSATKAKNKTNN